MSDEGAREKVGHCLRDMIASTSKRDDPSKQGKPAAKDDATSTEADVAKAPVATKSSHSKIDDPRAMPQNRRTSSKHASESDAAAAPRVARTTPYVPTVSLDHLSNLAKQHPSKTSVVYPPHPHISVVPQIARTFHNFDHTAVTKGNNPEMSMQQKNILRILEGGWKGSIDELLELAG